MEHDLIKKTPWYLITIDDPNFLSGESVIELIRLLIKTKPFKYVILDDIDCSGSVLEINKMIDNPTELETLFQALVGRSQFIWGDFFLFVEYPEFWDAPENATYPYLVEQTSTTIRTVDGQYFYIYTPYHDIVKAVSSKYRVESLKMNSLDKLDYPY